MKHINRYISIVMVAFTLVISCGINAAEPNVNFIDIRALGMGGPGVTTMSDFSALMYNPALLGRTDFGLDIINIQAQVSTDVVGLVDFIDKNQDVFDHFADTTDAARDQLVSDIEKYDDNPMGAGVYPKFGVVSRNFAVGIYGTSSVDFRIDRGIFEPRIYAAGQADLVYSGGYGMKLPTGTISFLPNDIYVGGALKIIERRSVVYRTTAGDADFDNVVDSLKDNRITGFGIDLGALYEMIPGRLDLGMKVVDILSHLGDDSPPIKVNVGASYMVMPNLLVAADYNDFFMTRGENFFNRLYMGGEYSVGKVFSVRAGFGQGYPAVGAGLDFGSLALDGAIYGVEKTTAPGGDGDYNYAGRLKIGM